MTPLQAAARLARKLPCTEHRCADEPESAGAVPCPVAILGREFPSINQAKVQLGLSTTRIYDWLRSGRARYL